MLLTKQIKTDCSLYTLPLTKCTFQTGLYIVSAKNQLRVNAPNWTCAQKSLAFSICLRVCFMWKAWIIKQMLLIWSDSIRYLEQPLILEYGSSWKRVRSQRHRKEKERGISWLRTWSSTFVSIAEPRMALRGIEQATTASFVFLVNGISHSMRCMGELAGWAIAVESVRQKNRFLPTLFLKSC